MFYYNNIHIVLQLLWFLMDPDPECFHPPFRTMQKPSPRGLEPMPVGQVMKAALREPCHGILGRSGGIRPRWVTPHLASFKRTFSPGLSAALLHCSVSSCLRDDVFAESRSSGWAAPAPGEPLEPRTESFDRRRRRLLPADASDKVVRSRDRLVVPPQ